MGMEPELVTDDHRSSLFFFGCLFALLLSLIVAFFRPPLSSSGHIKSSSISTVRTVSHRNRPGGVGKKKRKGGGGKSCGRNLSCLVGVQSSRIFLFFRGGSERYLHGFIVCGLLRGERLDLGRYSSSVAGVNWGTSPANKNIYMFGVGEEGTRSGFCDGDSGGLLKVRVDFFDGFPISLMPNWKKIGFF
ncbi:uncharacterized protein A4U43_C02F22670 [Asparagus officinalis]|uniref:Uncharacterized protein n=1 Tax=Asparagus officinalis TaxID=4686 RepID=A0A5P1FQ35_ASPOF|nr:uncharacterized protein A4U43_C02F22670 [Asparagus officinalis]